jgi:hypothetical protein
LSQFMVARRFVAMTHIALAELLAARPVGVDLAALPIGSACR